MSDDQVSAESTIKLGAVVDQRNWLLLLHNQAHSAQFVRDTCLIRRFQQAGPKAAMYMDRRGNDFFG